MSRKENKDINPFLLKFGVALAVSFAGFIYSRLRFKSTRPSLPTPPPSPSGSVNCRAEISDDAHSTPRTPISEAQHKPFLRVRVDNGSSNSSPSTGKSIGDRERFLLPEFNELVKAFDVSADMLPESETPIPTEGALKGTNHVERDEYEQEIQSLNTMVRDLKEREQALEMQLLEYYGLKEQETTFMELQNRLKINSVEAKVFSLKIEALQAEKKRLEAQVADHAKVVAELETAKAKIKELKKKLRSSAEDNKEQILKLKQRVLMLKLQEQDPHMSGSSASSDPGLLEKLQRLEDLENEREELRKSKYQLQRENSELARRLESTQILASSMFEDPEVGELHDEVVRLREENESLAKEVESLQADRCADAEALVYLKWVNACLRYELRNYQPPPGKTVARDLSKTLSPRSEAKAKQLILEYAHNTEEKGVSILELEYDQWSSSQSLDSGEPDEASFDASSGNKSHHWKKFKLFDKLRRLITGKDKADHHHNKTPSVLSKSHSVQDFRHMYSSATPRRNSISIPSVTSTRSSAEPELTTFTSASTEDAKDMETMRTNRSSSVSSSHSPKRFVLGGERADSISPLDHSQVDKGVKLSPDKPDIVRFAEALKDRSYTRKTHRKSASYSAF